MLALCFYLKLILSRSRFRIIVTHQDKAEDTITSYLTSRSSILYFIHHSLPFVWFHSTLLAFRDETKILQPRRPCDILPFQPHDLSTWGRTSLPTLIKVKKDYFKLIRQQKADLYDTGRLIVRSLFKLSFFKKVIQELAIRTP